MRLLLAFFALSLLSAQSQVTAQSGPFSCVFSLPGPTGSCTTNTGTFPTFTPKLNNGADYAASVVSNGNRIDYQFRMVNNVVSWNIYTRTNLGIETRSSGVLSVAQTPATAACPAWSGKGTGVNDDGDTVPMAPYVVGKTSCVTYYRKVGGGWVTANCCTP